MGLRLLFFAQCADWLNRRELEVPLGGCKTVSDVLMSRDDLKPLQDHLKSLRVALNQEFAGFGSEVHDGDEIALLPPVSGG